MRHSVLIALRLLCYTVLGSPAIRRPILRHTFAATQADRGTPPSTYVRPTVFLATSECKLPPPARGSPSRGVVRVSLCSPRIETGATRCIMMMMVVLSLQDRNTWGQIKKSGHLFQPRRAVGAVLGFDRGLLPRRARTVATVGQQFGGLGRGSTIAHSSFKHDHWHAHVERLIRINAR